MEFEVNRIKWIILGLLIIVIAALTLSVSPDNIRIMIENVSTQAAAYSLLVHFVLLSTIAIGLLIKSTRNRLFTAFIMFLSLSALVASIIFMILPNVIIFALFLVLIVNGHLKGELTFELGHLRKLDLFFGIVGLVFGFWYLHWVDEPVWLTAILYSPLGTINCPTMLTICAFLCLTVSPRSRILEIAVSLITLYFGFFGILILGVYVDVVLIACASYLIFRMYFTHKEEESIVSKGVEM